MFHLSNIKKIISIAIALCVWQAIAIFINNDIVLVGPIETFKRFIELLSTNQFYSNIYISLKQILLGLFLSFLSASIFAVIASRIEIINTLLWPYVSIMKSIPVASFVIICLLFVSSSYLSLVVVFIIVFPIVYTNMYQGFISIDKNLKEMLSVFQVSFFKRLRALYLPSAMGFFISTLKISIGMAFKSGVAAELIGLSKGSIGSALYDAKLYLSTNDIFAYTFAIVLLSLIVEKILIFLVNNIYVFMTSSRSIYGKYK